MLAALAAPAALVLVSLAALGAGAALLSALGLMAPLTRVERLAWSAAAGLATLGWLLFFPGVAGAISPGALAAYCCVAAFGVLLLRGGQGRPAAPLTAVEWLSIAGIAVAFLFDLAEAVSPPADADTLAYHLALPKQFLAAGSVDFVPRAGDGAVPMLVHMSYLAALGLGGERAATLWLMASGWAAAGFLYVACRRHVTRTWSLAAAAVFLTTPAVVYGGGSGQVETRLAMFALGAALAAAEAVRSGRLPYAVLAGCLAGAFAGGKFTGLLFLPALGLVFLLSRRWLSLGAAFSAAAIVAGAQWYAWNWVHTGDPVFPVLFRLLDLPDSEIWTRVHDTWYRAIYFGIENPVRRGVWQWLAYPVIASFGLEPGIEAGRTGPGPYLMLLAPFALIAAWHRRDALPGSPLAVPALSTMLYYTFWFFSGTSQRARHLVPLYPAMVLCVTVAAARFAQASAAYRPPIAAAVGATLIVQLAGHAVFSAAYVSHLVSGESREAFLRRTVPYYAAVPWINANMTSRDKVLVDQRQLVYLIDAPVFYGHPQAQTLVNISPIADDPARLWRQLQTQGITHLLLSAPAPETAPDIFARSYPLLAALRRAGCLRTLETFEVEMFGSRTRAYLAAAPDLKTEAHVATLDRPNCRL